MRPIATAVVRAGLVSAGALQELKNWGLPIDIVPVEQEDILQDYKQIVEAIQEALESHEQVRMQDTDLDIISRFLDPAYQREGTLHVVGPGGSTSFKSLFCFTAMGEIALPWRSEGVYELMVRPDTYFSWTDNNGNQRKSFFSDVRELFVGDRKAFMVCLPVEERSATR